MNIKQLEYICDIAELKSVTLAAEKNFLSQSTLSRELKNLERCLGTHLFTWEKREMRLTEDGILYLNGVQAMLQEYRKGMEELRQLKIKQKDMLHVIISPKVRLFFRHYIQPEFTRKFPNTTWELTIGTLSMAQEYLEYGFADLAIVITHEPEKLRLDSALICREAYFLALPSSHPAVSFIKNGNFSFEQLLHAPFFVTKENNIFQQMELDVFARNHFVPQVTYESNSLRTIRQMIAEGRGVGLLPEDLVLNDDPNIYFMKLEPDFYIDTRLLYPCGAAQKSKCMTLARMIQKNADFLRRAHRDGDTDF